MKKSFISFIVIIFLFTEISHSQNSKSICFDIELHILGHKNKKTDRAILNNFGSRDLVLFQITNCSDSSINIISPFTGYKHFDSDDIYFVVSKIIDGDTIEVLTQQTDIQRLYSNQITLKPKESFNASFQLFNAYRILEKGTYLYKAYYRYISSKCELLPVFSSNYIMVTFK
ncbi:hypothetical protein CAP35_03930 [Chitinophagaceae bacterium IBVUCB1]|nr:hypothetical protein CAP35_03930 [Chitinophagaceae bacterium IBVUCB1]